MEKGIGALMEIVSGCGPATAILLLATIALAIALYKVWMSGRREREESNEILLQLTDALDKVMVDDRENAEEIKGIVNDIRTKLMGHKEVMILKFDNMQEIIKNNGKK